MSNKVWSQLSPDEQKIVQFAAKKAGESQRRFIKTNEEKVMKEMETKGVKINMDVNFHEFQKLVLPLYDKYKEKIGADLLKEVLDSAK